jgi:hypothetical protein
MQTFYANSIEGCVLCGPEDLPEGGSWFVSDDVEFVICWLYDATETSDYYKVSNRVLIEVESEFGFGNPDSFKETENETN